MAILLKRLRRTIQRPDLFWASDEKSRCCVYVKLLHYTAKYHLVAHPVGQSSYKLLRF